MSLGGGASKSLQWAMLFSANPPLEDFQSDPGRVEISEAWPRGRLHSPGGQWGFENGVHDTQTTDLGVGKAHTLMHTHLCLSFCIVCIYSQVLTQLSEWFPFFHFG